MTKSLQEINFRLAELTQFYWGVDRGWREAMAELQIHYPQAARNVQEAVSRRISALLKPTVNEYHTLLAEKLRIEQGNHDNL